MTVAGGESIFELKKRLLRKKCFCTAAHNGCRKMRTVPSTTAAPLLYGFYGAERRSARSAAHTDPKHRQTLVILAQSRRRRVVARVSTSINLNERSICKWAHGHKVTSRVKGQQRPTLSCIEKLIVIL